MRLVRARAAEFGVEPDRIGFMGFSAGGNVALRAAFSPDLTGRPDFVAPIYATLRGIESADPPDGSGPMFLVVATDDELGLTDDSVQLYERWRVAKLRWSCTPTLAAVMDSGCACSTFRRTPGSIASSTGTPHCADLRP